MTTACITTTTTKTAAELLSDTLGHAWAANAGTPAKASRTHD
jgi:hypothetical protein